MKIYKCYLESKKHVISNIAYISAESEIEAAALYRQQNQSLKYKKGLTIEEIEHKTSSKISKVVEELIVYKIDKDGTKYKKLTKVSRLSCSECGTIVTDEKYCPTCDSEFV